MFALITKTEKSVLISVSPKFDSELETVCDYTCFYHFCAELFR